MIMLTEKNCIRSMYETAPNGDNTDCIAVVKDGWLNEKYKDPKYQLFHLKSGFGIDPNKMGNACSGYFCADGEECRMERFNLIGIADEETTKYALSLEAEWNK